MMTPMAHSDRALHVSCGPVLPIFPYDSLDVRGESGCGSRKYDSTSRAVKDRPQLANKATAPILWSAKPARNGANA